MQSSSISSATKPHFCPVCGKAYDDSPSEGISDHSESGVSLVEGHEPNPQAVQFTLGPYQVLKSIGQGGMGEVLLVYDTICGRKIALKRIRTDLKEIHPIKTRFLKEARVTSQLTHPSIIPIYSIHQEESTYYTMPYVEGETLKQIIRKARQKEKSGEIPDAVEGSIPALLRIFLTICQAVAYAHSKAVLHRDIKPENVIVGKYGEVMILDWGLAKLEFTEQSDEDLPEASAEQSHPMHQITKIGKVVGTVSYMAPERALGAQATKETDIYSLGVILFQLLTLRLPFLRKTLKEYRKVAGSEITPDPIEIAPYRDIPKVLSAITKKCLSVDPKSRYNSVDQLIRDLENYIGGRSEWFPVAELRQENKEDWEFQVNVLIAEHTAITRPTEMVEWVHLMISKESFAESIKIETEVELKKGSQGIGFLFNIPEALERKEIYDGYCLWLGTRGGHPTRLLRASVEVLPAPDIYLQEQQRYLVTIEKVGNKIRCYIDGILQLTYISRMPLIGTHVGLLTRDALHQLGTVNVFVGSQSIQVNCLSVPDAFLANKDYKNALAEYRRIASVFPGHAEGREAILRAGICLIEEAKSQANDASLFDAAQEEFEKLHETAGAPLEYLGKALIYEAQRDIEDEVKCFEIAFRRYPKHPLLHVLNDQVLFRLIESASQSRKATYLFLLLSLQYLPQALKTPASIKLIESVKKHQEILPWFIPSREPSLEEEEFKLQLAFWANKSYVLKEIAKGAENRTLRLNAFAGLALLKDHDDIQPLLDALDEQEKPLILPLFLELRPHYFPTVLDAPEALRLFRVLADQAIESNKEEWLLSALEKIASPLPEQLVPLKIWALLSLGKLEAAKSEFEKLPEDLLFQENSILYYLYGIYLIATEGEEIGYAHFGLIQDAYFPKSCALGSYSLMGKLAPIWNDQAFEYEKRELRKELSLFNKLRHRSGG